MQEKRILRTPKDLVFGARIPALGYERVEKLIPKKRRKYKKYESVLRPLPNGRATTRFKQFVAAWRGAHIDLDNDGAYVLLVRGTARARLRLVVGTLPPALNEGV